MSLVAPLTETDGRDIENRECFAKQGELRLHITNELRLRRAARGSGEHRRTALRIPGSVAGYHRRVQLRPI